MAAEMAYEKQCMGKGRKRKLTPAELGRDAANGEQGNATKTVYKWKRERKK